MNKTQASNEQLKPVEAKGLPKKLPDGKPDIFHDDNAYKDYLQYKEEEDRKKKERTDKVLDDYTYVQLNAPSSNYRSQFSDLIYRPQKYPVNIIHPARDNYTSQFVGFNQQSSMEVFRRNKALAPVPQQYFYQPPQPQQQNPSMQMQMQQQPMQQNFNPFQYSAGQQLGAFQQTPQMMPALGLNQGNLFYQQQTFGHPMEALNEAAEVYPLGNGRAINQIRF